MKNSNIKYIVSWREWIAGMAIYFQREFVSERLAKREARIRKRKPRKYTEVFIREEEVK